MKMLQKETLKRQVIELLCTDMLVPPEHLLRRIDAALDFTHIYDLVEDLYCEDNGRPSCDPVVLFKLVLIQHLFGIRSLRQTLRDVSKQTHDWGFTPDDGSAFILPRNRIPLKNAMKIKNKSMKNPASCFV